MTSWRVRLKAEAEASVARPNLTGVEQVSDRTLSRL